ncbi:Putative uncharacterized protein [Moritella viscosa]|nr:Putative uncharacterized protein [Moritella viscosa]
MNETAARQSSLTLHNSTWIYAVKYSHNILYEQHLISIIP